MAEFLSLLEAAELLGRYRYVELVGFARLGEYAPRCVTDRVALFFSAASHAHAWRARLFEELLPVSVGLPTPTVLTRSADPRIDEAFDRVVASSCELDGLDAVVTAVYPAMLAGYRRHRELANASSDGAIVLSLERAIADLEWHCAAGARLASGRDLSNASGDDDAPRDPELAGNVADLFAAMGGPFGPPIARG